MQKSFKIFLLLIAVAGLLGAPAVLVAAGSVNYNTSQEEGGPIEFDASSSNYNFKAELGAPGVGKSTSPNYIYEHGTVWDEDIEASSTVSVQWAVPELRSGAAGTNDDVVFYLTIRTAVDTDDAVVYSTGLIASTSPDGTYLIPIDLPGINPGTYDIAIKGHQHLTKKLDNVNLAGGHLVLNFSQVDYTSTTKGSEILLAGDINGTMSSTADMGDDKINALDLTTVLASFNADDPSGNAERANINQDTKVNALDLTTVLKNFNLLGDQ